MFVDSSTPGVIFQTYIIWKTSGKSKYPHTGKVARNLSGK